jgi:hypothetical protein
MNGPDLTPDVVPDLTLLLVLVCLAFVAIVLCGLIVWASGRVLARWRAHRLAATATAPSRPVQAHQRGTFLP